MAAKTAYLRPGLCSCRIAGCARYNCPVPRSEKLCVFCGVEEGGNPRKMRSLRPEGCLLSGKRVYLLIGWGQCSKGEKLGRGVCEIHRVCVCLLDTAQPHTAGDNRGGHLRNRTQVCNGEVNLELNSSSVRQSLSQFDTHQVFFLGGGRLWVNRGRCVVCACARVSVRWKLMRIGRMDVLKRTTPAQER